MNVRRHFPVMRMLTGMLATIYFIFAALPMEAWAAGPESGVRTVRVAFPESPGISEIDRYGRRKGLLVDYLNEIAKYTGWEYEYIDVPAHELIDDFFEGRFDLMGGTYYAPEFEQYFAYPNYNMGNSTATLLCRSDDTRIRSYDLNSIDGMTIGVFENATEKIRRLKEFLAINGLECDLRYFNAEELVEGDNLYIYLLKGDVDLLLGNNAEEGSEFKVFTTFAAQPYYIVTTHGNDEILDGLNMALEKIMESEPDFAQLHSRSYLTGMDTLAPQLEPGEQEYIRQKQSVKIAVAKESYPFCSGEGDGSWTGLLPDLFEKLCAYNGLAYSFVAADTYAEAMNMVRDGRADILGYYLDSDGEALAQGLATTRSYVRMNSIIVKNKKANYPDRDLKGGTLCGRAMPAELGADSVRKYGDPTSAIQAVDRGEIDFFYGLAAPIYKEIQYHRYANVASVALVNVNTEVKLAMARGADSRLLTIFNKSIKNLSGEDVDNMLNRSLVSKAHRQVSLTEMVYDNPLESVLVLSVFLCMVFAVVIIVLRARVRGAVMQAELEKSEARNRAKSEFLSKMSHEIRTPMNAIVGLSELISMDQHVPEIVQDKLNKIRSSSRYLLSLINDILDMSKIENGKLEIGTEPFALDEILEELQTIVSVQAEQKGLRLVCESHITHTALMGDPVRLRQVLMNLLSNAIKFTREGGTIQLKARETDGDEQGAVYLFSVRDTGIGISPEEQGRIFKPFEQGGEVSMRSQGTGLGLSISSTIVKAMGGELGVESRPGEGSTFFFQVRFPLAAKVESPKRQSDEPPAGKQDGLLLTGIRVLVAEDNELNAEIAGELIGMQGAETEWAVDGQAAVELFEASEPGRYQLILMDIRMPRMDGLEATRRIRAMDRPDAASIPIVAMTANSFRADQLAAEEAGMNGFIPKPVDVAQLFGVLSEHLQ